MNTPIAAQLAAAILGTSLIAADQSHVADLREEAAMMTAAMRELEARKMSQTTGALDRKYASAKQEIGRAIKIAAAITAAHDDQEKLAYLLEQQGMDKEAIGALIGGLVRAGGAALKRMGGAAQAAGRLKPSAAPMAATGVMQGAKVPPVAPAATKGKPFQLPSKGKLLAGGALLGTGYVGMKGMQTARDYMMMPSSHHGAPVMHNVNEYGYPQY